MIKTTIFILFFVIAAGGIWFWTRTDPQKLDFADRIAPGSSEYRGAPAAAIGYDSDVRQKVDIYVPEAESEKPFPVLLFFHGGAWRDGERDGYGFLGRAFAARGIVTVFADYRKSPNVRFPAFVEDTASAIAWVHANIARYRGDNSRIFLMGHSAGAHISMMAALDKQYLAAHKLDGGIISGVIGLAGPYDFLPLTTESSKIALGDWPNPDETQPIHYARADAPPLLLLTGDKDTVVKPRNSQSMSARVEALGGRQQLKI